VSGQRVVWRDPVKFRVYQPDLFATVLVCAARNSVCYNQNPGFTPILTRRGQSTTVLAYYGAHDTFEVWVALTADSEFLRGHREMIPVPVTQHAERTVHWLGPVDVTFDRE
jgi:hypothetical protein